MAAWDTIKRYFASLGATNENARRRSRLLRLRSEIVDLESQKTNLIEIVEAHIGKATSGTTVANDLLLSNIPGVLTQIDYITKDLLSLVEDGDMFAAENSFGKLKITLDAKKYGTLCELGLQAASSTPDLWVMRTLAQQLKEELRAISAAEEALGKYIKELNK